MSDSATIVGEGTPDGTAATFAHALTHHGKGELPAAESLYSKVLRADPHHFQALQLLGVIALQRGQNTDAAALFRKSLAIEGQQPLVHLHLGEALSRLGQSDAAVSSLRMAAHLEPSLVEAHSSLARVLHTRGRFDEALVACEAALRIDANRADLHNDRGNVLLDLRRFVEALQGYDTALALQPRYPEAWVNRAAALLDLGRGAAAMESCDRALALVPGFAPAAAMRARALLQQGRLDDALAACDEVLRHSPRNIEATVTRTRALVESGRLDEALAKLEDALAREPGSVALIVSYARVLLRAERISDAFRFAQRAVELAPEGAVAHAVLGAAHAAARRVDAALASLDQAIGLDPRNCEALEWRAALHVQLGRTEEAIADLDRALMMQPRDASLLAARASALMERKRYPEALRDQRLLVSLAPDRAFATGNLLFAELLAADWDKYDERAAQVLDGVGAGRQAIKPFPCLAVADSGAVQLTCARAFAAGERRSRATRIPVPHGRIRVAYLSGDLREHAVSYLMAGVWEQHDRRRFEVYALSMRPAEDSLMGRRVRQAFDHWIDISGTGDDEVLASLNELGIDIAVDLAGHTQGRRPRLFAERCAPVQVNYLGHPGTLGTDAMDYVIADRIVVPEAHFAHYTESVVWLPECFQANDDRREVASQSPSRASCGLPAEGLVWCTFSNTYKITPAFFAMWMRLLHAVPGSVLWLLGSRDFVQDNLKREAARAGVDPGRLVFAKHVAYPDHLARLSLADVCLDTLPFNGGTTASDALWSGVPLVTCMGEAFAARMAASLLSAVGLDECITRSVEDYEQTARALATDHARRESLRARLRAARARSPLFSTLRTTRHLEAAYEAMYARALRAEAPTHLAVPALD